MVPEGSSATPTPQQAGGPPDAPPHVLAAAAGVLLYVGSHHGITAPITTTATAHGGTAATSGGTLSCTGLEKLWEAAGGSPGAAFIAAEIATAESSGQQNSTDYDSNGTVDRGYWQINSIWGAGSTFDPMGNARAAVQISHDGTNWGPWVTFQKGTYQGKC